MKPLKIILFFIISLLFAGCFKDPDPTPAESCTTGTYYPDKKIITSDFGFDLIVLNSNEIPITEITRFLTCFVIKENVNDVTFKVNCTKVYDISAQLIHINEENKDSLLRNDPIKNFINMWIADNHLTIDFSYYAKNRIHYFFLSQNLEDQEDENVVLKFHHNAKGDNLDGKDDLMYIEYERIISVPINGLKRSDKDSVELKILFPLEKSTLEKTIWYKY